MSFRWFITRAHPVTSLASFRSTWHDLTAPPDPITDWYKRVPKRRREEGTASRLREMRADGDDTEERMQLVADEGALERMLAQLLSGK